MLLLILPLLCAHAHFYMYNNWKVVKQVLVLYIGSVRKRLLEISYFLVKISMLKYLCYVASSHDLICFNVAINPICDALD